MKEPTPNQGLRDAEDYKIIFTASYRYVDLGVIRDSLLPDVDIQVYRTENFLVQDLLPIYRGKTDSKGKLEISSGIKEDPLYYLSVWQEKDTLTGALHWQGYRIFKDLLY